MRKAQISCVALFVQVLVLSSAWPAGVAGVVGVLVSKEMSVFRSSGDPAVTFFLG